MLFPTTDTQLTRIIAGITLGLLATVAIIGLLSFAQNSSRSAMAATATATKTPTKKATATFTPLPTHTSTLIPPPTFTPTPTATPSATPSATATPTETSTATATPQPPPPTPTLLIVDTATITPTGTIATIDPALQTPPQEVTPTANLTDTTLITSTLITPTVGPPPPTATSVPRTVLVPADIPNLPAEDHFWFTRPFTDEFSTWGSYYYPYGTNARGQYFWHHGIDIQNPQNTPIVAVGDGTVVYAGPDTGQNQLGPWPDFYGQAIVLEHTQRSNNQSVYSLYGHVSKVLVQAGQPVKSGQTIGLVGQLGVALGPHLHLEIRVGSASPYTSTRNPDLWVRPDSGFGVIAGRVVDHENYFVPQQLVTLHRAADGSKFWRQTFTYPDNVMNSDESWGETFTFSDVPTGLYVLKTFFDGRQLSIPLAVNNQATTFVLLKQDQPPPPVNEAAPAPTAIPTPSPDQPTPTP